MQLSVGRMRSEDIEWVRQSSFFSRARPSALELVEFVYVDGVHVAEQQHQDGQSDCCFGSSHRQDEEHEYLPGDVTAPGRKRNKVHVHCKQHQFCAHKQNDQVAAVPEHPEDAQSKQYRAQYEEMAQCQRHHLSPLAAACAEAAAVSFTAAARSRCAGTDTRRMRSEAFTFNCALGTLGLVSLRRRRVSAMAATMPTRRITAAIWTAYTYSVYMAVPTARVLLKSAAGTGSGSSGFHQSRVSTNDISATITAAISRPSGR